MAYIINTYYIVNFQRVDFQRKMCVNELCKIKFIFQCRMCSGLQPICQRRTIKSKRHEYFRLCKPMHVCLLYVFINTRH